MASKPDPTALDPFLHLLICSTCGTQFPTTDRTSLRTCFICDDPRQFVPPTGQAFTDLSSLQATPNQHNDFIPYGQDLVFIHPEPRVGIGQRAILVKTPSGKNILWDCVTYLDGDTVRKIEELGGLTAIVISHPHFYGGHAMWAAVFGCPVYVASEDDRWAAMPCPGRQVVETTELEILGTGFKAIKLGGHFPGSMVGLCGSRLFTADTLMIVAAGMGDWSVDGMGETRAEDDQEKERRKKRNTFSFMWSYPNMIPLSADEMQGMWDVLRGYEFRNAHAGFMGMDIEDGGVKGRVLQSMQIQCERMGGAGHSLMKARV